MATEVCARMPQAIIAVGDFYAEAVIVGVRRLGLRMPDDVAVIGFDDLPNTAHFALGLDNVDPTADGRTVVRSCGR